MSHRNVHPISAALVAVVVVTVRNADAAAADRAAVEEVARVVVVADPAGTDPRKAGSGRLFKRLVVGPDQIGTIVTALINQKADQFAGPGRVQRIQHEP